MSEAQVRYPRSRRRVLPGKSRQRLDENGESTRVRVYANAIQRYNTTGSAGSARKGRGTALVCMDPVPLLSRWCPDQRRAAAAFTMLGPVVRPRFNADSRVVNSRTGHFCARHVPSGVRARDGRGASATSSVVVFDFGLLTVFRPNIIFFSYV